MSAHRSLTFRILFEMWRQIPKSKIRIRVGSDPRAGLLVVVSGFLLFSFILLVRLIFFYNSIADVKVLVLEGFDKTNSTVETLNDGQLWEVFGWDHFENLQDAEESVDLESLKNARQASRDGVWILRVKGKKPEDFSERDENWLILKDFQYRSPKPVMLGIRLFIEGQATLEFRFKHHDSDEADIVSVVKDGLSENVGKGFCNKIVPPARDKLVQEIEIRGYLMGQKSYIIIDQILVAVADNDSSRRMLFTFMPSEWCETTYGSDPIRIKRRRRREALEKAKAQDEKSYRYSVQNVERNEEKLINEVIDKRQHDNDILYLY